MCDSVRSTATVFGTDTHAVKLLIHAVMKLAHLHPISQFDMNGNDLWGTPFHVIRSEHRPKTAIQGFVRSLSIAPYTPHQNMKTLNLSQMIQYSGEYVLSRASQPVLQSASTRCGRHMTVRYVPLSVSYLADNYTYVVWYDSVLVY